MNIAGSLVLDFLCDFVESVGPFSMSVVGGTNASLHHWFLVGRSY